MWSRHWTLKGVQGRREGQASYHAAAAKCPGGSLPLVKHSGHDPEKMEGRRKPRFPVLLQAHTGIYGRGGMVGEMEEK